MTLITGRSVRANDFTAGRRFGTSFGKTMNPKSPRTGGKQSERGEEVVMSLHTLYPFPVRESEVVKVAMEKKVWGIASSIDIYECSPETIRDAEAIRDFVSELCELIEMKRFGNTQVVHFGEDEGVAGYSMVQLIETSLISAHFANLTNTTYLDVFSCKPYDPEKVREFSQTYFDGQYSVLNVTFRH
jgi:S-adenosylmethionine/arginine decarboxylase-like enzyme